MARTRQPLPPAERASAHCGQENTNADYECIARRWLGAERAAAIDFRKVHRFAHELNGDQLARACILLGRRGASATTEQLIDYLRKQGRSSNVDMHDLKGMDDLIQSLEAKIILPFENDQLARELEGEPKRGVTVAATAPAPALLSCPDLPGRIAP